MSTDRRDMARCPGCRDLGDAAHIAACMSLARARSFGDGALWAILLVEKQIARRGRVDWDRLLRAISYQDSRARERGHRLQLTEHDGRIVLIR